MPVVLPYVYSFDGVNSLAIPWWIAGQRLFKHYIQILAGSHDERCRYQKELP